MDKIIDTPTVKYTEYNPKCPFDMAEAICDTKDGVDPHDICDVVGELSNIKSLTPFGEEIYQALIIKVFGKATNKGVPKKTLAFYKKYDKWKKKNDRKNIGDRHGNK